MTDSDFESKLTAGGNLTLPYEGAVAAIDQLTARRMRVERWEGSVVLRDGTRARSLQFGGSFALSRDPSRAATVAKSGITRARDEWNRKPEFEGAKLEFILTFARV